MLHSRAETHRDMIARLFPLVVLALVAGSRVRAQESIQLTEELQEIFFRLYLRNDVKEFIDAPLLEVRNLIAWMNLDKRTVLYIHGYTGSVAKGRDVHTVVSAYLQRGDHNVIAMDWSRIANQSYPSVVSSAEAVGSALAIAIDEIIDQGLPVEGLHVVGHSMGAQVAGYAGRRTNSELPRITGLDPAGPFFNFLEAHLSSSDARFVDTIHTDAGFYGISRASGTASFYPNGGKRVQPGCPTSYELSSPEDYCSHHRSWIFYAESLRNENSFYGTECSSYQKFSNGSCDENKKIPMGFTTPTDTRGTFYLTTKRATPFGMQMKGASSTISKRHLNKLVRSIKRNTTNDLLLINMAQKTKQLEDGF